MISTDRVEGHARSSAVTGQVKWAPVRSIWTGSLFLVGTVGAVATVSLENVLIFLATTAITIGLGHSIGMHRLLIHRSFSCPRWLEYVLVWLGVLVGMAGPIGMIRIHDLRDWAQRQTDCHDFFAHRRGFWQDAAWQLHGKLDLRHPPRFRLEARVAKDPVYRWMERTWMLQQIPVAVILWLLAGWDAVIWGVALRVTVSLSGHWLIGHFAHRDGHQTWRVEGAAAQGFDLPWAALITFGESWHGNHHAYPGSARLSQRPGELDPGWWVLQALARIGLVRDIVTAATLPHRPGLLRVDPDDRHHCPCLGLFSQD
ncbi:acyl-CoA desaturase [Maricaulis alexandrii]|uniref:acyl-CoA desaturase n=1 Tax=Maricaulis alexandrii TaxID=2570354 RepID=UPI001F3496B2|nr:acyl-CoA desaturase [Maricaulis alexandrii]